MLHCLHRAAQRFPRTRTRTSLRLFSATRMMAEEKELTNRLGEEKSPYLLQHAKNPVAWQAWGPTAFEIARSTNRPILLSSGYSTCHWCHVMERESFEDEAVALLINNNFVPIKLDREEHPDIDQIYMSAAQAMQLGGGWPLNVWLTPDLHPFFAGTYFPRMQFIQLLTRVASMWKSDSGTLKENAAQVTQALRQSLEGSQASGDAPPRPLSEHIMANLIHESVDRFDREWGGFGKAPKFPHASQLQALLRSIKRFGDREKEALPMVELTLTQMARGGIFDHLGGGFARYSTDRKWLIPHFEKMLYDNALLVQTYAEAFQLTGNGMFAEVAAEVLDYVIRDMQLADGGFCSAEDADSEGVEGKFYCWTYDEVQAALTAEEFELFSRAYSVTRAGNFEHGMTNLSLQPGVDWNVRHDPLVISAKAKLFEVRSQRVRPLRDDKCLVSWNGLMVAAMALAGNALQEPKYVAAAQRAATFLRDNLWRDGKLLRRWRDGEAKYEGTLEDYAFLIHGLLYLYAADADPQWVAWAVELQAKQDELFWDTENFGYFFTPLSEENVLLRFKDFADGSYCNANGVAARNLLQLHGLTMTEAYQEKFERLVGSLPDGQLKRAPQAFGSLLLAVDMYLSAHKQLAIVAPSALDPQLAELRTLLSRRFEPNLTVAVASADVPQDTYKAVPLLEGKVQAVVDAADAGQLALFMCENHACRAPSSDVRDLFVFLEQRQAEG